MEERPIDTFCSALKMLGWVAVMFLPFWLVFG